MKRKLWRGMAHKQAISSLIFVLLATLGSHNCHSEVSSTDAATSPTLGREIEDNSRYKTQEANATLMKLLVDNKDGVSRSEIFDMLHSRDEDTSHVDLPVFPEDSEVARVDAPEVLPDAQAEFLQAPDSLVRKDSLRLRPAPPVGTTAGIMVIATLAIVCLGYVGLIVWRRIYLKRNGLKHELLRNEENIAETRIEF